MIPIVNMIPLHKVIVPITIQTMKKVTLSILSILGDDKVLFVPFTFILDEVPLLLFIVSSLYNRVIPTIICRAPNN